MISRIALACLAILLLCTPAFADETLFSSDVAIDVVGQDGADARSKGFAQAENDAFAALIDKLAPDQKEKILKDLNAKRIGEMVRGVEVVEEKIAGNRYRATLRVNYSASAVNKLLEKRMGAAGAIEETRSTATLILPIYEEEGRVLLWEPENPWRGAWARVGIEVPAGSVIVPFGDATDVAAVSAETAVAANFSALATLINRYGVRDVTVLRATKKADESGAMALDVVKRRVDRIGGEVNAQTYIADPQEDQTAFLARVARDFAEQLTRTRDMQLAKTAAEETGQTGRQLLLAQISTFSSWTRLRAQLLSVTMIDKVDVSAIAPGQVDMVVQYHGTPQALADALTAQGIRVAPSNGPYWIISKD